jgi:hypothetical protein
VLEKKSDWDWKQTITNSIFLIFHFSNLIQSGDGWLI